MSLLYELDARLFIGCFERLRSLSLSLSLSVIWIFIASEGNSAKLKRMIFRVNIAFSKFIAMDYKRYLSPLLISSVQCEKFLVFESCFLGFKNNVIVRLRFVDITEYGTVHRD